jgi:hypothetical protein
LHNDLVRSAYHGLEPFNNVPTSKNNPNCCTDHEDSFPHASEQTSRPTDSETDTHVTCSLRAGSPAKSSRDDSSNQASQVKTVASTSMTFHISLHFRGEGDSLTIELDPSPERILAAVADAFEVSSLTFRYLQSHACCSFNAHLLSCSLA